MDSGLRCSTGKRRILACRGAVGENVVRSEVSPAASLCKECVER